MSGTTRTISDIRSQCNAVREKMIYAQSRQQRLVEIMENLPFTAFDNVKRNILKKEIDTWYDKELDYRSKLLDLTEELENLGGSIFFDIFFLINQRCITRH